MRTQEAKQLPLPDLLARLGYRPTKVRGRKLWYASPLRDEKIPSFCVEPGHTVAWVFSDHGTNIKGNIIDFAMHYWKCDLKEALAWLAKMFGEDRKNVIASTLRYRSNTEDDKLQLRYFEPIQHPALISYLNRRAIPIDLARNYLLEVHYINAEQPRFALGWKTDAGGWCLRAQDFKACVSPASITTLGKSGEYLTVFEGMFDLLSALAYYRASAPNSQVVVLNGLAHTQIIAEKIKYGTYRCIRLYLDRDHAGKRATQELLVLKNTVDCSEVFSPAKDFAEWYEAKVKEL